MCRRVYAYFLLILCNVITPNLSFAGADESADASLSRSDQITPVQAMTSVNIPVPEQPLQPLRPVIESKRDLSEWDAQALSPSTGPFSRETKVMRVNFSAWGGDILRLDQSRVFIFGRGEKGGTLGRAFAKIIDTDTGNIVKELSLPSGNNFQQRILGGVSRDHRELALILGPQGDPGPENPLQATRLYRVDSALGGHVTEISLADEKAGVEDPESENSVTRRVEKITSLKLDSNGRIYLLGEKDEFRYAEKMFECDPSQMRDCEQKMKSKSLVGIVPLGHFVRVYEGGRLLAEERFKLPGGEGKIIPFNRIDLMPDPADSNSSSAIVYGPPVDDTLTVLKFPSGPQLDTPAPVEIESVRGDYSEMAQDDGSLIAMSAGKPGLLDERSLQVIDIAKGEIRASANDIGTFSFPGSLHRSVWDKENENRLVFTIKPTAAWDENSYVNIVKGNTNRSMSLTPLFRELIGGDKFSLRGATTDESSFIFSVAQPKDETSGEFDEYLVRVTKKDFYAYLKTAGEAESLDQNLVFDSRRRPVSITLPQGKIFIDWIKKTAAFVRLADGTRIDYDQVILMEGKGSVPSGSQEIAEYADGGRTQMIAAQPDSFLYADGSYDRVLSFAPKAIAFFSSSGALLDIRLGDESLKDAIQSQQAAHELGRQLSQVSELTMINKRLDRITKGLRAAIDRDRLRSDLASYLQIKEMLHQAEALLTLEPLA